MAYQVYTKEMLVFVGIWTLVVSALSSFLWAVAGSWFLMEFFCMHLHLWSSVLHELKGRHSPWTSKPFPAGFMDRVQEWGMPCPIVWLSSGWGWFGNNAIGYRVRVRSQKQGPSSKAQGSVCLFHELALKHVSFILTLSETTFSMDLSHVAYRIPC